MRSSFQIGRLAGVRLKVHVTFGLIVLFALFSGFQRLPTWQGALSGLLSLLLLFACVVLHELGHSLMAARFHIRTVDITLWPMGGVARLERMPPTGGQELVIAAAGPAVNLALSALAVPFALLLGGGFHPAVLLRGDVLSMAFVSQILSYIALINVALLLFNLIPAFPMDGGRILRGALSLLLGWSRATQVATLLGQGIAILFVFVGVFGIPGRPGTANISLLLVGLFVFLGASQEAQGTGRLGPLARLTVADALTQEFAELHPLQLIGAAVHLADQTGQPAFPVMENGLLQGLVLTADLDQAYYQIGRTVPVTAVMRQFYPVARLDEPLDAVRARLREARLDASVVMNHGQVVGLVTQHAIEQASARAAGRKRRDGVV